MQHTRSLQKELSDIICCYGLVAVQAAIASYQLSPISIVPTDITPNISDDIESIQRAICYLADRCDGAETRDGQGYNGEDSKFGKALANQINSGDQLKKRYLKLALGMLAKYQKQLSIANILLPRWDDIAHSIPLDKKTVEITEDQYQMVLAGDKIRCYSPYDSSGKFQKVAKTVEGYKFEKNSECYWSFPLDQATKIVESFSEYQWKIDPEILLEIEFQAIQISEALTAKINQAEAISRNIVETIDLANLDGELSNGWILRDYQKTAVRWLLERSHGGISRGGILADEMGLGKTLEALVAAKTLQQKFNIPVLVICPISLINNWYKEAGIAGVSIECFSWAKIPQPLESQYILIADEAHYAQNEASARTKKLLALALNSQCMATWLLTGTPIKNGRPVNLMPLLIAIDHPIVKDKWTYLKRYCSAYSRQIGKKTVWEFSGSAYEQELSQKTTDAILRRVKIDHLKELPPKSRVLQSVSLHKDAQVTYSKLIKTEVESYRARAKRGEVDPDAEALVTLNILRKIGSQAKIDSAIEFASEVIESGNSIVIFTEFVESAIAIHESLGGELLTGDSKDRQGIVDRFQSGESKVFVGTIKAGGVGITLTAASTVLLVDRPWTPGDTAQAEDRIHRLGQTNACFAYWLQLGVIDTKIDELIASKQEKVDLLLEGKEQTRSASTSAREIAIELMAIL